MGDALDIARLNLINHWSIFLEARKAGQSFIHFEDIGHLKDKYLIRSREEWIAQLKSESPSACSRYIHTSIHPTPYGGNLKKAEILLLLLNPGFATRDYRDIQCQKFSAAKKEEILQKRDGTLSLDFEFAHTGGFEWWTRKFKPLAEELVKRKKYENYFEAYQALGRKIASLELFPYPSQTYKDSNINPPQYSSDEPCLPSSKLAVRFARAFSANKNKTIIVLRREKKWKLAGKEGRKIYTLSSGEARSASLNPTRDDENSNKGKAGRAILKHFDIVL